MKRKWLLLLILGFTSSLCSYSLADNNVLLKFINSPIVKTTYLPSQVWNVNENNDYHNPSSQFSLDRMYETKNLAAFWEAEFGDNPANCKDEKFRFPLDDLMKETEKIYVFFRDELKFSEKGNSLTDKYRMNLYFYYSEEGTLYGGGTENKIGIAWITPNRVKYAPYGGMAHELGHSFQYMVNSDGKWGFSTNPEGGKAQAIWEMTSQYMLWQYYPNWIEFENYHLKDYLANCYKAFLHEDNCYNSPHVLEYWADLHGKDFIGKLWHNAKKGEDPVLAYKRLTGISQEAFINEMFDAARKFITWDIERIREVCKPYVNSHSTELLLSNGGWYKVAPSNCPQNYGYNGIALEVPSEGQEIIIDFDGIAGSAGYRNVNVDSANWRYGFVAYKNNGERVYGDVYSDKQGKAKFVVPKGTKNLWFVVLGAPLKHWEHLWDNDVSNDEQWPYQIKISGSKLLN